jgi:hypothetical protein
VPNTEGLVNHVDEGRQAVRGAGGGRDQFAGHCEDGFETDERVAIDSIWQI